MWKNIFKYGMSQITVHNAFQVISYLDNFPRIACAHNIHMVRYINDWENSY